MSLVLRGLTLNDEATSRPLIGRFDERGGRIGRSDNVTFTLPDPERVISRNQAEIHFVGDAYWLENLSAANPILHNGRPLSSGMRVALKEGDEVRIGGYTLQAAFEHDETSITILRGRTTPPAASAAPAAATPAAGPPPPPAAAMPAAGGPPATGATPAPNAAGSVTPGTADLALWQAFVRGAQVDPALPNGPTPELMAVAGAMLRNAIAGVHHLISMRAVAKTRMQAEMTMIQARGNNPLKFAPDPAIALKLLLQPPARGFLAGPEALNDALIDLQSHQVGVMAGMRSALEAVLDRFDPAHLEAQLSARSVFDSLMPAHRRARLWELYLEHFRTLRAEAHDDFHRLFGEAFLGAYEAHVRNLEEASGKLRDAGGAPR